MEFVTPPEKPPVNFLLYGPTKTGKTIGAGSIAAKGKVLYVNANTPNATRQIHLRWGNRIAEPKLPAFDKTISGNPLTGLQSEISSAVMTGDYYAVVLDELGELHRRMLEWESRRAVRPSLPTYGDVTALLERFCRFLVEAPINTVLVCHELVQSDDGGGTKTIPFTGTQAGSPVLGQKLLGMVDVVGYVGVVQREEDDGKVTTEYGAQIIQAKGRQGGDRFACLNPYQPLDLAMWMEKIEASEEAVKSGGFSLDFRKLGTPKQETTEQEQEAAPAAA